MSAQITNRFISQFTTPICLRLTVLAFLWLSLASCTQKPWLQTTLAEYQSRLANILEAEPPSLNPPKVSTTEISKQNYTPKVNSAPLSLKLREFYNLPDCGIKPIIAERNTTLGKIQAPSQRYLYEVRLLHALQQCLTINDGEHQLELQAIVSDKERALEESWRQLLLASEELVTARYSTTAHFNNKVDHRTAVQQWQSLLEYAPSTLRGSNYQLRDEQSIETLLHAISKFKTPAKLHNDMQLLIAMLPEITRYLEENSKALRCNSTAKDEKKAEYLHNVFNLFFIQKIQPFVGKINDWYYPLSEIFEKLEYNETIESSLSSELHDNFIASIKAHVVQWQAFFERCNITPGN